MKKISFIVVRSYMYENKSIYGSHNLNHNTRTSKVSWIIINTIKIYIKLKFPIQKSLIINKTFITRYVLNFYKISLNLLKFVKTIFDIYLKFS